MSSAALDPKVTALNGVIVALTPLPAEQRRDILRTAAEWLGVDVPEPANGSTLPPKQQSAASNAIQPNQAFDKSASAKDFLKAKQPKTDVQRLACLGYYITNIKGQPEFNLNDLRTANTDAKWPTFSNLHLTMSNATRQNRFFSSLPGKMKQLTSLGEQVVEALPDQEAVGAVAKLNRKPRKKAKSAAKKTPKASPRP